MSAEELRVFVAMPGTDMGSNATWNDPDQIKRRFYDVIANKLQSELDRPVRLVVEKEKTRSGPIYSSMYSEAWQADVYLADLTGANANVYLELGVRWAMSDGVTVLLAQDPSKLKFNVVATRAEPYSSDPDQLEHAIDRVVQVIVEGLRNRASGGTDSPVRENGRVRSIANDELTSLKAKLVSLQDELKRSEAMRGEDFLKAAAGVEDAAQKVALLREAIAANPYAAASRFELGRALRELGNADDEAIEQLLKATRLAPTHSPYLVELGVALSKSGQPDEAIPILRRALEIDNQSFEAASVLGGAQRRLALIAAPDRIDWKLLEAARTSYDHAAQLAPRDTYPLLNVARIDLLFSNQDPARGIKAVEQFGRLLPLCQFERDDARRKADTDDANWQAAQEAAYKAFDYADCMLFGGRPTDGVAEYSATITSLPEDLRADVMRSAMAGLSGIAAIARLGPDVVEAIAEIQDRSTNVFQ